MIKAVASITSLLVGVSLIGYAGVSHTMRDLENNIKIIATDQLLGDIESSLIIEEPAGALETIKKSTVDITAKKDITIALVGSDTRSGQGTDFGKVSGSRSDTTILIKMNADRNQAAVISIARDLKVDIPACERENGSKLLPQSAKFNAAYAYGGPNCMLATIKDNFGITVDHIAVVDFLGFQRIVDIIGGVEVCLARASKDKDAMLDLPAGRQILSGEDALAFVRARKGLGDGSDISRSERQKMFLGSVIKSAEKNGIAYDIPKLYQLLVAISSSLSMDKELASTNKMLELALDINKIGSNNIQFIKLPWSSNGDGSIGLTVESEQIIEAFINTEFPINISKKSEKTNSIGDSSADTVTSDSNIGVPYEKNIDSNSEIPTPTEPNSAVERGLEFEQLGFSANLDMCDAKVQ
jgi:LCP family protein required for cell wall assembly